MKKITYRVSATIDVRAASAELAAVKGKKMIAQMLADSSIWFDVVSPDGSAASIRIECEHHRRSQSEFDLAG